MARKAVPATPVRGAKTQEIIKLAMRPQGVTGVEIMAATGWPSGSAGWRVGTLADRLGMVLSDRIMRDDGTIGYALLPAKPAAKVTKATKSTKAPRKSDQQAA